VQDQFILLSFLRLPRQVLLPDPLSIPDVSFSKAVAGLFDINFEVNIYGI
jgi:hypothetical protein